MTKFLSDKLRALSFCSIIMVVYIHAFNLQTNMATGSEVIQRGYNSFIQDFVSHGIASFSVPLFFIISGFLYFINMKTGAASEFIQKYKRRFETVVLPYLIWSVLGILFVLLLQSIPPLRLFFSQNLMIKDYSLLDWLDNIFINPVQYQFWFLRDLIVLIAISPVIYYLIKYLKVFAVIIFLMIWLLDAQLIVFKSVSLFFFGLGSFFGIQKIDIEKLSLKKFSIALGVTWIALICLRTIFTYESYWNYWVYVFHSMIMLLGVITIWSIYDTIVGSTDISTTKLYSLFQYTFFIFAFHEPALTMCRKISFFVLGRTQAISLAIYFIAPVLVIITAIACGFLVKKAAPRVYTVITGGR
ncbi:acyltransferase [Chitinophagaceae bacterium 26-R-25]|nr:acyltransferase [Chitinophagaceae bacterium 26-R-25]